METTRKEKSKIIESILEKVVDYLFFDFFPNFPLTDNNDHSTDDFFPFFNPFLFF